MARTVSAGDKVLVRLALLPGMKVEDEPTPEKIMQMKLGLTDAAMMGKMLNDLREQRDNPDLTANQLHEELYLYPRIRPATVSYVDRTEGRMGTISLDVQTPGSTHLQGAVGRIPKYAQQNFRLENVQFYTKEPGKDDPEDGSHFQHVAFWAPEPEEEAPARMERKQKK